MRCHSSLCRLEDTREAARALTKEVQEGLAGRPDALFVFLSADHAENAQALVDILQAELQPRSLLGVSGEGVLGGEREIERASAISMLAIQMPGAAAHPFHISRNDWDELLVDDQAFERMIPRARDARAIIGFGDPFTTPLNQFLARLDEKLPGLPLIGGLASSARQPNQNVLLVNDEVYHGGFAGVCLSGNIAIETLVSQGCRPFGQHMVITKAHDNVIEHLGGRAVLEVLREAVETLEESEQQLLQNGLFIGRAISEYQDIWGRGDFLVRAVMGMEQATGGLGVTDFVRVGQTVQFHIRDAATAEEDLSLMLQSQRNAHAPAGGLLFSCNGRGTRMFSEESHDISAARRAMPRTPIAGFFAAGELGPIGGKNFIHGQTASFALFRPKK